MVYLWLVIDVVCLLLALGIIGYRKRRNAGKDARTFSLSLDENRLTVTSALRQLNCKMNWTKDDNRHLVRYTFQGGHFIIVLEKGSPYARLTFPYIFSTDTGQLDRVRMVCNLCNFNSAMTRLVYNVNEKEGKIDLHITGELPVVRTGMKTLLEYVMEDAFRWQKAFADKFNELDRQRPGAKVDEEKGMANYEREVQLVREQEMTHQAGGPNWHESGRGPMALGSLMAMAMGLHDIIPISLTLTVDGKADVIDDPDAILGYPVSHVLIGDGKRFCAQSAVGLLHFYDPGDPIKPRHLTLNFEREETTRDALYYRVTLSLAPLSTSRQLSDESEEHKCRMVSVLLGFDLTPSESRVARFRYLWKEAMGKMQSGDTDSMTPDERLLAGLQDEHVAENYYNGYHLYQRKRFYEALPLLRNAFHAVTRTFDLSNKTNHVLMEEIAYLIGCCYLNLHQYECANYYLQLLMPTSNLLYSKAYINCLVNSGDYRALSMLDAFLTNLNDIAKQAQETDDDDAPDEERPDMAQLNAFAGFIRRRKAYLLVSLGRYDEAERLLKTLLDDPDNSDFALSELAYIQQKKK